jgi:hypothetical protein
MKHLIEHDYISMFEMILRELSIENLIDQLNHIQYDRREVLHPNKLMYKLEIFIQMNSYLNCISDWVKNNI